MNLKGAKVLVVGLAKSGIAAAELLRARGAEVLGADEKPADKLPALDFPVVGQSAEAFTGKDLVVLSPGVPADLALVNEARTRGVAVVGEVEVASWFLQGPILGITGSNGKTTTTALTGHLLKNSGVASQVGGNIGTAVASMVATSTPETWNVLELSSFQLETIDTFHARIGAALNVTPDHLDRHKTFDRYWAAKGRLFENQTAGDFAVLNAENEPAAAYAKQTRAAVVWFSGGAGLERGVWVENDTLLADGEPVMRVSDIPLRGRHNLENTAAAVAAARLTGAGLAQIAAAVTTFPGVEHRIEFVRTLNGVEYYNDSKATNVDATIKALESFPGGIWIILGGKDKDSDYAVLRDLLTARAKAALLIGKAADKIAEQVGGSVELVRSGTLAEAIAEAHRRAQPGEVVLLAPACASFDQFDNYEHRGRVFKDLVRSL